MSGCWSSSDRLFHSVGPAVAKQQSPNWLCATWWWWRCEYKGRKCEGAPVDAARAFVRLYADVIVMNKAAGYANLEVIGSQLDRLALDAVVWPWRALELGEQWRRQCDRRGGGQRRQDDRAAAGGRRDRSARRVAGEHARRTCIASTVRFTAGCRM